MSKILDVSSLDSMVRDLFPQPGDRIKQWVVDSRKNREWEQEACPRFAMPEHDDNTGVMCCYSSDSAPWIDLDQHHCCNDCNDKALAHRHDGSVVAWRAERAARPKPCADHSLLSDEVAPNPPPMKHPFLSMVKRGKR